MGRIAVLLLVLGGLVAGLQFSGTVDFQTVWNSIPEPMSAANSPVPAPVRPTEPPEAEPIDPPEPGDETSPPPPPTNQPRWPELTPLPTRPVEPADEMDRGPANLPGDDFVDANATGLPREWTNPKDGMVMVLVPGSTFVRGANSSRQRGQERPLQRIFVDGFYVAKYAVSRAQFERFIRANGYSSSEHWVSDAIPFKARGNWREPEYWTAEAFARSARLPVVGVSWFEADAYSNWIGGRLPSEVEWEKAARGTTGQVYPWGDQWRPDACNWHDVAPDDRRPFDDQEPGVADAFAHLAPVDAFADYASPYGAVQMTGNVYEWCADWLDPEYFSREVANSPSLHFNPSNHLFSLDQATERNLLYRVLKGGAYTSTPEHCLPSFRYGHKPYQRYHTNGFRYVLSLDTVRQALAARSGNNR